jgi:hypothetical protein
MMMTKNIALNLCTGAEGSASDEAHEARRGSAADEEPVT